MYNIYYNPEKFGLEEVGKVEWAEPCYSFDTTVVWRRSCDGQLLYASDSGCSCPSPFEDFGVGDLTPVSAWELQEVLERISMEYDYYERGRHAMQIVELVSRAMNRGLAA